MLKYDTTSRPPAFDTALAKRLAVAVEHALAVRIGAHRLERAASGDEAVHGPHDEHVVVVAAAKRVEVGHVAKRGGFSGHTGSVTLARIRR